MKLAIATTLVVNVRVPFNFTTWNKVVYTFGLRNKEYHQNYWTESFDFDTQLSQ